MRRPLLWLAGLFGGLVLLVVVGTIAFLALGGAARLKPFAESLAGAALGREVTIESMTADLGWQLTTLHFTGLRLANRDWAGPEPLAELDELVVSLRPKTLLRGPLELPRVVAQGGRASLVRSAEGEDNWSPLEEAAETAAPEERSEFPEIGELLVSGIDVSYEDRQAGITKAGRLESIEASANQADGVALELTGVMDEQALEASFAGGSFDELVGGAAPYPVDLRLAFNDIVITAQGSVAEPAAFEGIDVQASIEGRNFADLYPLIPAALPATPPFSIEGALIRQGEAISLSNFTGRIGDSDVDGTLAYDTSGERPLLTGRFHSTLLDFDDLAPLIGAAPNPEETVSEAQAAQAEQSGALPDEPIPVERFRAADLDIELDAEKVVDAVLPVESLKAHFGLTDARLEVRPLELGLAGGTASGEIAVNARETPPSADLDIAFQEIWLKPFFEGSQFVDEMGGLFSGNLYLLGVGESLAQIAGTARGHGVITVHDATISGLIVEAAGLDVVEALALVIGDDVPLAVRCGGAGFLADGGLVEIRQAFADTTDSLLVAGGRLDLDRQVMDLQVEARAKDFSLIDMSAPVRVSGPLDDPGFAVGGLDPLPFFELGEQEDIDCEAAYRELAEAVRPRS